jgi:hypothetical protein
MFKILSIYICWKKKYKMQFRCAQLRIIYLKLTLCFYFFFWNLGYSVSSRVVTKWHNIKYRDILVQLPTMYRRSVLAPPSKLDYFRSDHRNHPIRVGTNEHRSVTLCVYVLTKDVLPGSEIFPIIVTFVV